MKFSIAVIVENDKKENTIVIEPETEGECSLLEHIVATLTDINVDYSKTINGDLIGSLKLPLVVKDNPQLLKYEKLAGSIYDTLGIKEIETKDLPMKIIQNPPSEAICYTNSLTVDKIPVLVTVELPSFNSMFKNIILCIGSLPEDGPSVITAYRSDSNNTLIAIDFFPYSLIDPKLSYTEVVKKIIQKVNDGEIVPPRLQK